MYLYLTDESNRPPEPDRFFVYGGLVIDADRIPELDRIVRDIRTRFHYLPGETFKFSNVGNHDATEHRDAKAAVLAALPGLGASFIATTILRQVIGGQVNGQIQNDEYIEFAINTATAGFHKYLRTAQGHGIMLLDRDADPGRFNAMAARYQEGLQPAGYNLAVNDRIHLFGMTSNNASHLSSAADIALGAFRYCLDYACGVGLEPAARSLMTALLPTIWSDPTTGVFREYGYVPRPVVDNIYSPAIRATYDRVADTLRDLAGMAP